MDSARISAQNNPFLLIGTSFAAGGALAYAFQQYQLRVAESRNEIGRSSHSRSSRGSSASAASILEALSNQTDLSLGVLNHLTRVYATLGLTVLTATAGSVFNSNNQRLSSGAASFISLLFGLSAVNNAKLWKLLGFGFFSGCSLSELLRLASIVDPAIGPFALASTTAIFSSFAVASTLTTRRSLLFLYGGLNSALSIMTLSSLANMFFKSEAVFNLNLYGGLAMFLGYVAADTQLIIERADLGDRDHVQDATMLFTDGLGIFTRMLILLIKRQAEENSRKRKERNQGKDVSQDQFRGLRSDYDDTS